MEAVLSFLYVTASVLGISFVTYYMVSLAPKREAIAQQPFPPQYSATHNPLWKEHTPHPDRASMAR